MHSHAPYVFGRSLFPVESDGIKIKLYSITQTRNHDRVGRVPFFRQSMSFAIALLFSGILIIRLRYLFIKFVK